MMIFMSAFPQRQKELEDFFMDSIIMYSCLINYEYVRLRLMQ